MLLIGQLAKQTGIPVHTIRYYEKYGLFKGRRDGTVKSNNYTWYDAVVVEKLELIKEAKESGFTLSEIKKLIDAWHSNRLSKEKKIEILQHKLAEIEEKIKQLRDVKKLIAAGIKTVEEDGC
jgi:MerR family transcriptional regulator, copper efflux regulator